MSCPDDLKLFAGGAILMLCFLVASYWIEDFRTVVASQFAALIGAAAMKMKGDG